MMRDLSPAIGRNLPHSAASILRGLSLLDLAGQQVGCAFCRERQA